MSNIRHLSQKPFQEFYRRSRENVHARYISNSKSCSTGTIWNHPCVKFFNDKLAVFSKLFNKQCAAVIAHRTRRTTQIVAFYRNLYGHKCDGTLLKRLRDAFKRHLDGRGKLFVLLSAVFFNWDDHRITNQELESVSDDLATFLNLKTCTSDAKVVDHEGCEWERVVQNDHFTMWRCPVEGSSLYKYKVFGSYKDLPASCFYKIQLDLEYRKKWDSHVIKLERVAVDEETGSEVIYWATQFPLGVLYNRDYVYVRRFQVDRTENQMVITAHSVDHPHFPETKDYIRVGQYNSQMLIKPHSTFEENGFDYVMSYYDDPQLYVPTWMINKMTLSSLPMFLNTLHGAAKQLHQSTKISSLEEDSIQARLEQVKKQYGYAEREQQ